MKLSFFVLFALATIFCGVMPTDAGAQLSIAANGKSTFRIVTPANAPTSVQNAAQELQKDIELATGAKLPIQKDDASVSTPILSIGSTQQAKAAGISSEQMADESFRIVTENGNLYILGLDTPDDGWTKKNGVSNGTANGVYTFLEDYLGVRWLMPGEIGRDVPKQSTLVLKEMDRTQTPKFSLRHVTHIYDYATAPQYANIAAWSERQKLGGATDWDFNHNWWRTINRSTEVPRKGGYYPWAGGSEPNTPEVKSLYAAHPEWFAMDKNGERPFPKSHYYKLETTNPELVKWFAQQAVKTMKASERPIAFSLSPSDGSQWSQSPESKALYDPNPDGGYDPEAPLEGASMSSLVAKWYHDIAGIVAREYPQGRVTVYIYSSYIYPPQKVSAKLPDNFTPQIAPSRAYGYGLYREDVQEYFRTVTDDWAKIVTGDWFYYDLPTQLLRQSTAGVGGREVNFPGSTGLITPAAPEIVNFIFPQLLKSHINGANIYGVPSWSNAALSNYILAKMEWEPTLNANDLQREWLHRAYGDQAGAAMEQFYAKLDDWFRDYYRTNEKVRYELPLEMLKDLYGAHYPEMEKLFLQAKAQPMNNVQKQRLQLIEDNLIVLQWRLRNLRYLPANFVSPLQRSDAQISDLIAKDNSDFALFPGITTASSSNRGKPQRLPWKVQLSQNALAPDKSTQPAWDDSQFLIYAAKDGDIRITPQMVTNGAYFAAYEIKNQKGELVASGIFNTATPIVIPAKAGESYMLTTPLRKPANFQLQVQNAVVATGDLRDGTLYLSGKSAPVYVFYVPGKNPVGAIENEGGAKIRKPFSDNIAQSYAQTKFSDVRLLKTFDDGWIFSPDPKNDGVARGVLKADFDDSDWKTISPLDWWQMQGFADYHGPAWYRIKFDAPAPKPGETARLYFGAVDGNAVVYLNGKKIGEHTLGPDFAGWDKAFTAPANRALQPGENTLVVQVTSKNDTTASGIFKGVALILGVPR
jgi:hypothetical protein